MNLGFATVADLSGAIVTRLEKAAVDNGFDHQLPRTGGWLSFASTQTTLRLWLTAANDNLCVVAISQPNVAVGIDEYGEPVTVTLPDGAVAARAVPGIPELHHLVRRAFQLSRSLPDALLNQFLAQVATMPRSTEAERLVVQRIGQNVFRNGLLEYWQGECAITGLALPELLRASHIKPWASCERDAERLDVFNGLLLAPHLDAAFDAGLITVAQQGEVIIADALTDDQRRVLGLDVVLRMRRLEPAHQKYLVFHRDHVFRGANGDGIRR